MIQSGYEPGSEVCCEGQMMKTCVQAYRDHDGECRKLDSTIDALRAQLSVSASRSTRIRDPLFIACICYTDLCLYFSREWSLVLDVWLPSTRRAQCPLDIQVALGARMKNTFVIRCALNRGSPRWRRADCITDFFDYPSNMHSDAAKTEHMQCRCCINHHNSSIM